MCTPPGKASRVEDAVVSRRVCFWRRSFSSFGESPGSLEPGGRIWIEEEGPLVNDIGEEEMLGVGVIGDAIDLDLSPRLLLDILWCLSGEMSSMVQNEHFKLSVLEEPNI
jgi:hypothetical protein